MPLQITERLIEAGRKTGQAYVDTTQKALDAVVELATVQVTVGLELLSK